MKIVERTGLYRNRYGDFKALDLIKQAGFDGFDYSMTGPDDDWYEPLKGDDYLEYAKKVKDYADSLGLPCLQAHAPYANNLPDKLDSYVEKAKKSMRIAKVLGCKNIVIHPINYFNAIGNADLLYRKLIPLAEELDIVICTENMFNWKNPKKNETIPSACGNAKDFVDCVDCVESPHLKACLDLGHANMVNCEGASKFIKALGNRIVCLHVHDNDLYDDQHTLPYVGNANWDQLTSELKEIGYNGHFTFEEVSFVRGFPDALMLDCLKFKVEVGKHLASKIEG